MQKTEKEIWWDNENKWNISITVEINWWKIKELERKDDLWDNIYINQIKSLVSWIIKEEGLEDTKINWIKVLFRGRLIELSSDNKAMLSTIDN
jgi:hypothetical protein